MIVGAIIGFLLSPVLNGLLTVSWNYLVFLVIGGFIGYYLTDYD